MFGPIIIFSCRKCSLEHVHDPSIKRIPGIVNSPHGKRTRWASRYIARILKASRNKNYKEELVSFSVTFSGLSIWLQTEARETQWKHT